MYKMTGIALLSVLTVAGCGGGGGDSFSVASVTTPTSVSGTAAKGIVKQAKVLVCRIVNGVPEADAACATTTTGADGSYRVTFSDGYTGPAMVKVMAGTAAGMASTMMDETTGADIPYNMTMRALVPAVSGTTTAYVTPFSEMAASAMGATLMDATTITQAINTVQSVMSGLGIDLSVMPMMDLKNNATNSTVLTMQANMVKQLSRVAMAAKNSSLFKDASGVACNTLATDSLKLSCVVSAMAGVMNNYLTADPTKFGNMMTALNAQNVTGVTMPILQTNGALTYMGNTNMTSLASMTTAMQNAGMSTTTAANTANTMMGGMR